jgi:hypothetical protein
MNDSETKKVDDFCAAINASQGLDLRGRCEALKDVSLPEGFHTVVLRHPDTGAFAGYWSSTARSGSMVASRLCGWLSRSGYSSVRSAAFHEPEEWTVNLVLCQ